MTERPTPLTFISYRHSDGKKYANELSFLLRAAGLRIWQDSSDMPPGDMGVSVEQVLRKDASSAVIVITDEVENSLAMREIEVPTILDLEGSSDFPVLIANAVQKNSEDGTKEVDYSAPDRVLRIKGEPGLGSYRQINLLDEQEMLTGVSWLVEDRLQEVSSRADKTVTIDLQSHFSHRAYEDRGTDLQIRINPGVGNTRALSRHGLADLQRALPLVAGAASRSGVTKVRFSGRMHLTPALAVGAAFAPATVAEIEVCDSHGQLWSSSFDERIPAGLLKISAETSAEDTGHVLVFVSLINNRDEKIFQRLIDEGEQKFSEIIKIFYNHDGDIDSALGGAMAEYIANEIKSRAGRFGRPRIHLVYHGPKALAILIVRLLTTFKVAVYERLEVAADSDEYVYRATMLLDSKRGIASLFDVPELGDDGQARPERG